MEGWKDGKMERRKRDVCHSMRMTTPIVSLVLLLALVPSFAPGQEDREFEQRRQRLIDVASREKETSPFSISARLALKREIPVAVTMLDSLARDRVMGGMFFAYTLIGTYLYNRDLIPDSIGKKIRRAFAVRTMYRGDTENHWVMYYVGMYLAAQTWPGEDRSSWFNGRSSSENFEEAKGWLHQWMETTSTIGQGEFDSPTYSTVFLTPLTVLYEFATDSLMKRKAHMMLDLLFADFAAEHLKGSYAGAHSRDYPEDIVNPLAAPSTMWAWLYFGEPKFEQWDEARYRPRNRGSWETLFGALSSYRLPPLIVGIATDRSTPYVHTETKRVRNIIRFGDVKNPPVYKYTFMTADYAIGSIQGGILQPIQQHTWDITFGNNQPNNTLFTLHPYYSAKELAMFFPEEQKFLAAEVDRYHKIYTNPDKWNSSSPYEQTFQHKSVIIVLYDIPVGEHHPHIDGFFPKNLDDRHTDSTGWIFCRKGNVYVAFFPLKPYEWIDESMNWRWRSHDLRNGIVVEVGRESEQGSFDAFKAAIRSRKPVIDQSASRHAVLYVTLAGDRMQFTFGGKRVLNGSDVDFSTYRLFNGPFVQGDVGAGVITLSYQGKRRILDFKNVTITER
jgi:hypothetical protein